ncbi:hypothetical protein Clacol_003696 [Clathrus columnatus]|uniref:methylated diphthine methylhydrolase n=1 Tax=Clathrus columnatus TaxID=1419009 RepID=A0AAV5A8F1_9AGAM|nr:hypothetical protein Clacol_003696 [Clathrus columnatus]
MSYRVDTVLPADTVEFCPYPELTKIFAVGTYKLEEEIIDSDGHQLRTPRRWGRCLLFEVDYDDDVDQWLSEENSGLVVTDTWIGHEFEPWVTAWNRWDRDVLYTGGDDCKLKAWDYRLGYQTPIFENARFDGGVTAIQSNPHAEHVLAVGSYDAIVRIFDARRFSNPVTQVAVGGGAWRVKWHHDPVKKDDLLVACMHDGFKVVTFDGIRISEINQGVISFRFDEHNSLAYGVDWSYASSTKNGSLVGSCSFYDHELRLWRI